MTAAGRKTSEKKAPISVGVALLPPDGWREESSFVESVGEIWSPLGELHLRAMRLGDDPGELAKTIRRWADREGVDVLCTVGRSGHRPEDFAPDTTRKLLHRSLPGIEERMYLSSPRRPEDLLFRGAAGLRGEAVVINFPARRGRARSILRFLAPVLRHALEKAAGDESECAR
jgi:molybdopterin biosynthesis enzyme MoaB